MDFWCFLFLPFSFMAKIGKKFEIRTLVANMIVLELLISASVQKDKGDGLATFELESLKTQSPSSLISKVADGSMYEICSESNLDIIENCSLKHINLDSEDLGTSPYSFSENQWTAMEERASLTSDCEDSNSLLTKPFEGSQDLQSVIGALPSTAQAYPPTVEPHNCEIKQPENNMNNINNHVLDNNVNSCDSSEEYNLQVASNDLNRSLIFMYLLILLLDGMIIFIGKKLEIGIGVIATIVLGYGTPGLIPYLDVSIVMYLIAYSLMFLSMILRCASSRELLSYIMVGVAYTCSTFGIFSIIVSTLPSEYAFSCIGILILVLFSVVGDGAA